MISFIVNITNNLSGVFKVDNALDLLNITFVSINIISAFYLKRFINKSKKIYNIELLTQKDKRIIDIILAIEMLFFAAIYVFLGTGRNEEFGGITDPSLVLYTVAELTKGLGFMLYLFLTTIDVKRDFKKFYLHEDKIHGCNC